jgi:hypothetical protein
MQETKSDECKKIKQKERVRDFPMFSFKERLKRVGHTFERTV